MVGNARFHDREKASAARGPSLRTRVREGYRSLPPTERRLADLVLNFPGELAGYSALELARLAETSSAAVSRFVRRLGFANYEEMRRLARKERESGAPSYMLHHDTFAAENSVLDRHVEATIQNIRNTFGAIDQSYLTDFAARVAAAKTVWIIGFRHGFFIASYLKWSLAHARPNVRILPASGETFGETLVDISNSDVVIVFAMRRRVPAIPRIIQATRTAGAAVAVVTDPGMVDTCEADWVFRCESRTTGLFDDHAPALIFAHMVTDHVTASLSASAVDRLSRIDDLHDRLVELAP